MKLTRTEHLTTHKKTVFLYIIILLAIIYSIFPTTKCISSETSNNSTAAVNSAVSKVYKVLIKGNKRIDTAAILDAIQTRKDSIYNPEIISQDIKSIYDMGYFDDVAADVTNTPKGKIVTFIVHERPIIDKVVIKGNNELSKDKIKDVLSIKKYDILNEHIVKQNIDKIENLYSDKGYINTVVTAKIKHISASSVELIFSIKEGQKTYIKSIKFIGNHAFSSDQLKNLMDTTEKHPWWWLTWKNIKAMFSGNNGILNKGTLDRDIGRISSYYHDHGYIDAKVGSPNITRKGKWVYISIPIDEGYQYRVASIKIKQHMFPEKSLLSLMKLKPGDIYSQKTLRQDILKINDKFADKGYAYIQILPQIQKIKGKKEIRITLNIDKGPKVYFQRIQITGNTKTEDKVIRRELRVKELEPFSATGLRKSNIRLNRLGFFKQVTITPKKASAPNKMNLDVKVKEQPTGTFSIGAGYSSIDKLLFMAQVKERNFMGTGDAVSFQGSFSSNSRRYTLSFTNPYFRDTKLLVGVDLYNWLRDYYDYSKKSTGGALRFGYPFTDNLSGSITLRADNTRLSDLPDNPSIVLLDSLSIHTTRSVTMGLTYNTKNSYFYPTHGWDNSLSAEYAGGVLGGDSAFVKVLGNIGYYHPIWKQLISHERLGVGFVTQSSGGRLPIYEKFFLGGIDTIRGYRYGHISPIDPATGDRIGGSRMAYLQNELMFPILKNLGLTGVMFYDVGNVWKQKDGYDISHLKDSVGIGIRWMSPIGPLRIVWGYKLHPEKDESRTDWEFRIGGMF